MNSDSISRRKLLSGVAGGGAASLAGLALVTEGSHAYTDTMQLQTGKIEGLVLDWRETYNGSVLTDTTAQNAAVSPSGPAISLGNVLPGDSGSLSVRLRIDTEAVDEAALAVEPEMTFALTSELASPGLQEFVDAAVWYDTGLFDVDAFGGDNAERDPGERLVHPDASGSLADLGVALGDGVTLDASPSTSEPTCLGVDDAVTVTFGWSFPTDQVNSNAVKGDAVEFDIRFAATQC